MAVGEATQRRRKHGECFYITLLSCDMASVQLDRLWRLRHNTANLFGFAWLGLDLLGRVCNAGLG